MWHYVSDIHQKYVLQLKELRGMNPLELLKKSYTLDEIKAIIEARAKDLGSSGKDNIFGYGRLRLSK